MKLYANQNGQLSTQSIWTSPALSGTTSLAWGDWNNDSRPDLAVGNDDGPVQVYSNLGSQPGAPQFTLTWSSQEGGSTTGVAWGDANRDGYLDLAVSRSSGVSGVYRNTSVLPWRLPNPPAYLSIARPGKTLDAYLYSSSELLPGYFDVLPLTVAPTVTVYYSAYHTAGMPITNSVFEYSLDGGSTWATASAAISTALSSALTQTAAAGRSGVFIWDAQADGAISDNAVFRVRAADQNSTGPVQRAAVAAISPPFRVRGLSCIWPNGLSIDYSPKTIAPFAQVRFVGILAESSSDVMTYTWNFDDGTFGNGKEVTHAFDQEGFYTVRLSAVSATCPTPQPLQAIRVVKVGNPSPFKLYLPLVAKNSTSAQALSVSQAARPPANIEAQPVTAPRSTIPSVARLNLPGSAHRIFDQPYRAVDYGDHRLYGSTGAKCRWNPPRVLVHRQSGGRQPGREYRTVLRPNRSGWQLHHRQSNYQFDRQYFARLQPGTVVECGGRSGGVLLRSGFDPRRKP